MSMLGILNVLAAIIIFVHCTCRISLRRWHWRESGLWVNTMLIGGSVGSIGLVWMDNEFPAWPKILINWGLAMLFTIRAWRLWRDGRLFPKKGGKNAQQL